MLCALANQASCVCRSNYIEIAGYRIKRLSKHCHWAAADSRSSAFLKCAARGRVEDVTRTMDASGGDFLKWVIGLRRAQQAFGPC